MPVRGTELMGSSIFGSLLAGRISPVDLTDG